MTSFCSPFSQHTAMGAVQAAVKKLKGNHSPQERSKFLREAAIMGSGVRRRGSGGSPPEKLFDFQA